MNDSDVQELLQERADMAPVPPPPIDAVLRDETARRTQMRRLVLATAALAAVAVTVVAAVAYRPASDAGSLPTTQTNKSAEVSGTAPTEDQLIGSWRAVTILGQPAPTTEPPSGSLRDLFTLKFAILEGGQLWWGGQNWCNPSAGRVRLGTEGQFSTFNDASPLRGCLSETYEPPDVSVPDVVVQAASVRLLGDALTLYDQDGSPLARFVRAGHDNALYLCQQALRKDIGSATATTVGVIRMSEGPGPATSKPQPARHAFGDIADSAPGAWCWVDTGLPFTWALYGVGPDGTSVLFAKMRGYEAPTGLPAFR